MCKKRNPFQKYNSMIKRSVRNILLIVLVPVFWIAGCSATDKFQGPFDSDKETLAQLASAITERDAETLWLLKDHDDETISNIAWNGLIHSSFDDVTVLINYALENDHPTAWTVLSHHQVSDEQLNQIEQHFFDGANSSYNVCRFFERVGSESVLRELILNAELFHQFDACSRAAGVMLTRIELDSEAIDDVAQIILSSDDESTITNLLYGLWRSPINRPKVGTSAEKMFIELAYSRINEQPKMADEYLLRLTGTAGFDSAMYRRDQHHINEKTQFALAVAFSLRFFKHDAINEDHLARLLNHPNPVVPIQALESLKQIDGIGEKDLTSLEHEIKHFFDNAEVALTFIELLATHGADISSYKNLIDSIDSENPYLKSRVLSLYKTLLDENEYYLLLAENMQQEGIEAMHAAMALTAVLDGHANPSELTPVFSERLDRALADFNRSIISVSQAIFLNRDFYTPASSELFIDAYQKAVETHQQSITQILLNAMQAHGIEGVETAGRVEPKPFRMPDWESLNALGKNPIWMIETTQGLIRIKLKPADAPFTVSSVYHLTENHFYDEVVFHRVVPNFVIQGGDFDREDGFGGPDYRIPTEPYSGTFKRGMVGIASSGPDTEGSQFFITHTWTPHLDGLYTIFGEVIEGMDVVDKIQVGDRVLRAWISVR